MLFVIVAVTAALIGAGVGVLTTRRNIAAHDAWLKQTINDLAATLAEGISTDQKEPMP